MGVNALTKVGRDSDMLIAAAGTAETSRYGTLVSLEARLHLW